MAAELHGMHMGVLSSTFPGKGLAGADTETFLCLDESVT